MRSYYGELVFGAPHIGAAYQHDGPAAVIAPVAAGDRVAHLVALGLLPVFLAQQRRVGIAVVGCRVFSAGKRQPAGDGQPGQDDGGGNLAQPPRQR